MSSAVSQIASSTGFLQALQMTAIGSLAILSGEILTSCLCAVIDEIGIATSLYLWVIPIILIAPDTKTKITQFNLLIENGALFLQPSSRALGASFASLAVLFYCHPNTALALQWKYYALAMASLVTTAPYEIYAIFPTNEKLAGMGKELDGMKSADFGDKRDKEVDILLKKWAERHLGRILTSLGALMVSIWSVVVRQDV